MHWFCHFFNFSCAVAICLWVLTYLWSIHMTLCAVATLRDLFVVVMCCCPLGPCNPLRVGRLGFVVHLPHIPSGPSLDSCVLVDCLHGFDFPAWSLALVQLCNLGFQYTTLVKRWVISVLVRPFAETVGRSTSLLLQTASAVLWTYADGWTWCVEETRREGWGSGASVPLCRSVESP